MPETPVAAPRVDVAPLLGGRPDASAARRVREQLRRACTDVGFVTVTGHGVARETALAAVSAAGRFFGLPDGDKLAAAPRRWNPGNANVYRGYFPSSVQGKEGLDVGEPLLDDPSLLARPYHERNVFPSALAPTDRAAIARYFAALSGLGTTLLGSLAAALGGDPRLVERGFSRPASLSTLRFNRYPASERPVSISKEDGAALCCEEHVDSGFLTLLYQDEGGGLQLRRSDGRWVDVEPDPESFIVNTGLALERMTGRQLAATLHRVRYKRRPRLSVPFFLEPVPDFRINPRSLGLPLASCGASPAYESFLRESLAKFPEYAR